MMKIPLIALILIIERFIQTEGDHEFKVNINIEQYHNSRDRLQDGSHCELFRDKCDPLFHIKIYDHSDILRNFATKSFSNTNFIHQIDSFDFQGEILPEILTVKVEIFDVDILRQQIILDESKFFRLRGKRFKIQEFSNSYSSVIMKFNITEIDHSIRITNEPTKIFSATKTISLTTQIKMNDTSSEKEFLNTKIICLAVLTAIFSVIIIFLLVFTLRNYSWIKKATKSFIEKMKEDAENLMRNNSNTKTNANTSDNTNRKSVPNDPYNIYEECV